MGFPSCISRVKIGSPDKRWVILVLYAKGFWCWGLSVREAILLERQAWMWRFMQARL